VVGAVHWITTDADAGALAVTARRELPDGLIGERAGAADDADIAALVDVTRGDADAAAAVGFFAVSGVTRPGQFGPMRRVLLPFMAALTRIMSLTGMPSVMATTRSSPASTPSRMASAAKGGGTKMTLTVAPVSRAASAHGVKDRHLLAAVLENLAAFARRDTGDELRAVVDGGLRVTGAEVSGDALNENAGVSFNENGHAASFTRRIGSSRSRLTRSASTSMAVFSSSAAHTKPVARTTTHHSHGVIFSPNPNIRTANVATACT
jgi:hypothetical protein